MKILVLSLPDLKKIYPQRPHQLLKHLSKKHEVIVLSVNAWWLDDKKDEYLDECLKNVTFLYVNRNIHPILQEILMLKGFILQNIRIDDFDLILSFHELIATYFLSVKKNIPVIFDICDDVPRYIGSSPQIPFLLRPLGQKFAEFLFLKNIASCSKITYTLESLKNVYHIPEDKALIVPNGVDSDLFFQTPNIKPQFGFLEDDFIIGFVGFIGYWVDLEFPLRALRILNEMNCNTKMLIVGDGDYLSHFKHLADELHVLDYVIFTGSVPYTYVPKYISCMDVCLLPFKKDEVSNNALPLKLFEYMSCEKPVISSKLNGVINSVGDKVLYASNENELTNLILKLYKDDELRLNLGYSSRNYVLSNYSWGNIISKFESIFQVD